MCPFLLELESNIYGWSFIFLFWGGIKKWFLKKYIYFNKVQSFVNNYLMIFSKLTSQIFSKTKNKRPLGKIFFFIFWFCLFDSFFSFLFWENLLFNLLHFLVHSKIYCILIGLKMPVYLCCLALLVCSFLFHTSHKQHNTNTRININLCETNAKKSLRKFGKNGRFGGLYFITCSNFIQFYHLKLMYFNKISF